MIYTKTFQLSNFEWIGNAKRVVEMICNAGKSSEFVDLIKKRFDHENDTAADFEISKWVIDEVVSIMGSLGLTLDGKPVKKKFKVFYRITGVSYEEVEADNAEEAREKFLEEFNEGDPLYCINRDDIETVVPISYEENEGDTKDYGPSEESRQELENSLAGVRLFALVRVDKDECGTVETPSVRLFASLEEAKQEMLKDYAFAFGIYDRTGNVDSFMPVEDGIVTCYVYGKDGTEAKWNIIEVLKKIERSSCVSS
jgi:hypothetical protein